MATRNRLLVPFSLITVVGALGSCATGTAPSTPVRGTEEAAPEDGKGAGESHPAPRRWD